VKFVLIFLRLMEMKRGKGIIIGLLIAGVSIFSYIVYTGMRYSEQGARQYLNLHRAESEKFALECFAGEGKDTYNGWDVDHYVENGQVEFLISSFGFGPSVTYKGICYSVLDISLGFQGVNVDFTTYKDGWKWEENDGDNWQYNRKNF